MSSVVAELSGSAEWAEKGVEYKFPQLLQLPGDKIPQARADVSAYTYGWDTVFAIRMPDVNEAIIKSGSSPESFSQIAPDNSCSIRGTFGAWQLCGGDGVDLHFEIPIVSGNFLYQGKHYPLNNALVKIEVQLNYIPPQPKSVQVKSNPSRHELVMRTVRPDAEPVVSVIDLTLPGCVDFIQKALMREILKVWFNANLNAFSHVFSAVNINRIVDKKQFQWLAPTHTSYAFAQGPTPESSILGVLCMTQGHNNAGIASQLSPDAIPPGARSGFLISQERFLEEMVLPCLPKVFPDSSASDFAMSIDKTKVINTSNLKTRPVSHAGTTYHPVVTSLSISVSGEEVIVTSVTRTDIALDTYCETIVTSFQRLKLATRPDGRQTMVYEESRPAIKDHHTTTTASGKTLKIILEIAAAVVSIILTILTDGAFLIVSLIIISLLVGLVEAVPELIANVVGNRVSNNSPSLALLTLNATEPVQWTGASNFRLTSISMNDSLQLGGDPGFE